MTIVYRVLEAAQDNEDEWVIGICRRLIIADRLGWRKHVDPADMKIVLEFARDMHDA